MRTPKAVPVVLRQRGEELEILVFAHPEAGTQIVKGTVEQGESVAQAAVRELTEEAGIPEAQCEQVLGTWDECPRGQVWHFRRMAVPQELPDSWSHFTEDDGGHVFTFSWHPLGQPAPGTCHPVFVAALSYVRAKCLSSGGASQSRELPSAA